MQQIVTTYRLQDIKKARERIASLRATGLKCWMTRNLGPNRCDGYLMIFMDRPKELTDAAARVLAEG